MWKKWDDDTWYNVNTGHILKQMPTLIERLNPTVPDRWLESVVLKSEQLNLVWKDFETKEEALAFVEEFIK